MSGVNRPPADKFTGGGYSSFAHSGRPVTLRAPRPPQTRSSSGQACPGLSPVSLTTRTGSPAPAGLSDGSYMSSAGYERRGSSSTHQPLTRREINIIAKQRRYDEDDKHVQRGIELDYLTDRMAHYSMWRSALLEAKSQHGEGLMGLIPNFDFDLGWQDTRSITPHMLSRFDTSCETSIPLSTFLPPYISRPPATTAGSAADDTSPHSFVDASQEIVSYYRRPAPAQRPRKFGEDDTSPEAKEAARMLVYRRAEAAKRIDHMERIQHLLDLRQAEWEMSSWIEGIDMMLGAFVSGGGAGAVSFEVLDQASDDIERISVRIFQVPSRVTTS